MNSTLAKLIALKERIASIQGLYSNPPADLFESMRDQLLKDVESLKAKYPELEDFKPQNYSMHKAPGPGNNYFKWGTRALIGDVEYFINFLSNIESVQTPNVKVSEEGVFFAGQHFDALLKFNDIISKATKEIILIDNYLNEKILELLASKNTAVACRVLTLEKSLSKSLTPFVETFNKQYQNLKIKTTSIFHDRFVIIDQSDFYHFGASIKDAGNKGFMFSKIEEDFIKEGLMKQIEKEWAKETE